MATKFIPKYRENCVEYAAIRNNKLRLDMYPHLEVRARFHGEIRRTKTKIGKDEKLLNTVVSNPLQSFPISCVRRLWPTDSQAFGVALKHMYTWGGFV